MDYFDELSVLFESEDANMFRHKPKKHTATPDIRLIDVFDEITSFVRVHARLPSVEAEDMQEAILGTGLNTIRSDTHKIQVLEEYDELGLLEFEKAPESLEELFADDKGLFGNEAGIFDDGPGKVISYAPRPVEERAERTPVADFDILFKNGFVEQQAQLSEGSRKLVRYDGVKDLVLGGYYIHDGQMLVIANETEKKRVYDRNKERFRVVYENGVESNMYRRSLSQRLREDGYTVVDTDYIEVADDDVAVGHIYVLKSLSQDPKITTISNLYKIGVTRGSVEKRIGNAINDPTYLMAPVEIIEDYRLTGEYIPHKVEDLIHQIFGLVKVDLQIISPSGTLYTPQEWYSVPLDAIVEAVDLIATGEIINYHFDIVTQSIRENDENPT